MIKDECKTCSVGIACGTLDGQPCEFIDRTWKKNDIIYRQGEPASHAWYIKEGTVALRRRAWRQPTEHEYGKVRELRFVTNFIGLELLVTDESSDTAIAGSDVTLCGITRAGLDQWVGPKTSPARTALELSLRTQATSLTQRVQREGGAVQRAASWLLHETPKLQKVELQRKDIADLLNMRAETLSRVLGKLCAAGAIAVGRTYLEVTDVEALQDIAEGRSTPSPTR